MTTRRKPPTIDRLPQHSSEAELGILSCCFQDPKRAIAKAQAELRDAEVFYDLRHQTIFNTLKAMNEEGIGIDMITLHQRLKDKLLLEQIGGIGFIATLPDIAPSAANLPEYLVIVKNKYLLREMTKAATDILSGIYGAGEDITELMDEAEQKVLAVRQMRVEARSLDARELVKKALENIEAMWERKGGLNGIATGFHDWDRMTGGMHNGEVIIIAAFPGNGKTTLAMNIAEHVSIELDKPVGIFSLEMSAEQLMTRCLSSRARVNLRNVRDGFLAERDFPKLTGAAGKLAKARLYIKDRSDLTAQEFRAEARQMRQQYNVELIVLDYLQLLTAPGKRSESNRQQEVSDISRIVKATARELMIPIICLSQLNDDGRLRESRAIGQDADGVGMLFPADEESDENADAIPFKLKIQKQRNGPTGTVPLIFLKSITRFETAARVSDNDVPN